MLTTQLTDNEIEVQDGTGAMHKVTKRYDDDNSELFNIQAREYLYRGRDASTATELYTTSSAVIHLIDSPLSYGN
jgi:hypothetical protein